MLLAMPVKMPAVLATQQMRPPLLESNLEGALKLLLKTVLAPGFPP